MLLGNHFFEGKKSSEREAVYDLIKAKFQGRKLTLDALHCIPKTLCFIASHEGYYIVQVKANQKEMLADLMKMRDYLPLMYEKTTTDKGHGRIEERTYHCYDIREEYFAPRWNNANIKTLIIVKRKCTHIKTGELTDETSYYISNQGISKKEKKNSQQLCHAVRGHWSVENHHQIRDVTLKEDNFRTPKDNTTKFLAVARSWVINLYRRKKTDNFAAAVQNTAENQNKIRKLFKIK